MSLADDFYSVYSYDKQFITVVTKGGYYFYIIIDRSANNVGQQYESELIASIIDDAVFILETLDGGMYE